MNSRMIALQALRHFVVQANLVALVASDPKRFENVERRELVEGLYTALEKLRGSNIGRFIVDN